MASQDLATNLSAALSQVYAPKLIRQFNRQSVLATLLMKQNGQGKNVAWDNFFSGASAASYTDGADVSTYDVDTPVAGTIGWGLYRSSFAVTGLAQAAAATSLGSADELVALIESSAQNSASKLIRKINTDLFTGTAAPAIVGLGTAIAATGTYAGISQGTYSEWASTVNANGGTPRALTKVLMDTVMSSIRTSSGLRPNLIVCDEGSWRKLEAIQDTSKRVIVTPSNEMGVGFGTGAGSFMMPNAGVNEGWTGTFYKNIPVFTDIDCPDGFMYFLNTDFAKIKVLPQPGVNTAAIAAMKELQAFPSTNMAGLAARIEAMAKTGDADKFTMKLYLQLEINKRNAHGLLKDIDIA
jgi:hypothetical protein